MSFNNKKAGVPWYTNKMVLSIIFLVIVIVALITPVRELADDIMEKIGIGKDNNKNQEETTECKEIKQEETCKEKNCLVEHNKGTFSSCKDCPKTCNEINDKNLCLKVNCNKLTCKWDDRLWPRDDICIPS